MKTMKFIYRFILILSALALAASCVEKVSDADILAGRDRTTIEVSYALGGTEVKSVTVASASIKKTLEVTVNNENLKWNLESNRDWCEVVSEEHCGSGTVTLNIAANEDFEAREPATLTFVAGDYRGFQITVNQNAAAFIIGQPYFVSGIDGGSYNVNVTTPAGTDWTYDAEDWMEVTEGSPSSNEEFTTTPLTIKAAANDGASRYGTLNLSAGEEAGYINIYQFGTELTYEEGSILLEGTEGAGLTLTAPAYVVNSVMAPKFAAATVTENGNGTSTVNVVLKENLSDCSENREVELSLQLANASATIVELPSIVQDYIPANGLVTGKGMMAFAKAVAEGQPTTDWEDNGVVTVKGEIDMSEVEGWTGIGTADSPFKGKFNGGGFEITDLKNTSAGLFAYCEGATIQNVVLGKGCSLYYDKSYTGLGGAFGGIVSVAKKTTTVTACQFDGAMDFAGTNDNDEPAYIGGIVGYADETSTVTKSKMTGKIVLTSPSTSTESYVGGIVGMSKGTITNNEMGGEVLAQTGNILTVGGIASALPAETKVGSNSFMGTLTMGSGNTSQMIFGGLYGKILADRSFDKTSDMSVTLGTININGYSGGTSTSLFVGGFIGRAEAGVTLSFNGYEAQTNIFYDQTAVRTTAYACFGGILGGCDVSSKVESVTFENVSNQGSFTTEYNSKNAVSLYRGFVGGIAGYINGVSSFVNCKNQGEPHSREEVIGLLGIDILKLTNSLPIPVGHGVEPHSGFLYTVARSIIHIDILLAIGIHSYHIATRLHIDRRQGLSIVVYTPQKWSCAILVTIEHTEQHMGIRRTVRVHRRIGIGAYGHHSIRRETNEYHRDTQQRDVEYAPTILVCGEYQHTEYRKYKGGVDEHTSICRHTHTIDHKGIKVGSQRYGIGDDNTIDSSKDKHRDNQGHNNHQRVVPPRLLGIILIATEEEYHHQRWDSQQVEDVDTYRQTHKVGNKDYPTHRRRTICILLPLEHQPHYQRCEHRRQGIDLTLNGREPEGVGIGIRQRTYDTSTQHKNSTIQRVRHTTRSHYTTSKVGYSPKHKEYGEAAHQRIHTIDHHRHILGRGGKERGYACQHHKEWCPGRVTHLELVGCCYKLTTIPQTCRRLHCHPIGERSNSEDTPAHDIIPKPKRGCIEDIGRLPI